MRGSAGGSGGTFAAESHDGPRPQTAEIIKTFRQRCPTIRHVPKGLWRFVHAVEQRFSTIPLTSSNSQSVLCSSFGVRTTEQTAGTAQGNWRACG